MTSNKKIFITAIIALLSGLGAGYLIFGNNQKTMTPAEVQDQKGETMSTSIGEEIWTCSMHPQIRQNEPGDCPLCGMDLILLEENASNDPLVLEMTTAAVKMANIQTTVVGESNKKEGKTIRLSGKVQADERLASSQVAHVPGRIEKLFVSFTGEQVNKGQKIATLYSPELITAQRELLEALKLKDLNPGLLDAARNKLRYWKIGNATIESIEQQGKIQETFSVYADESGIVTAKRISVGDYVKQGEPLFDLMNLRKVWVLFDAYEEDLGSISMGDKIEFTTPSIPNKTFKTRITFIDPIINPATRVASLRTEVNNSKGLLKPEMFVQGMLQNKMGTKTQITVPKSAVLWTGTRSVVYVKVPDTNIPSFQFREVELGESLGNTYQLTSGLETGEEVVTYGSFTIDAAAQLNNQASMINRQVSIKGTEHSAHLADYTESTPSAFKEQLFNLASAYLTLKDALVATNSEDAKQAVKQVLSSLNKVDMSLVEGEAHLYWMKQESALQAHSKKISELNEVEEQREQFNFVSQALIKTIKVFGISGNKLFIEHCPMAFDNKGADWLSREKEIRNPYFGDKMLTCGVVKDTITKDFRNPPIQQASSTPQNFHNH